MTLKTLGTLFIATLFLVNFSCAISYAADPIQTEQTYQPKKEHDPLEGYNRLMFRVNEELDDYFLKPIAELYRKIVPRPLARGVRHMYSNVGMLPTTANDILQGNFYQATSDAWRFAVNSTFGIAGFYDLSSKIGLDDNHEDFGLTLARWGYVNSTYVVLPLFGPSTIRDTMSMPVDYYAFSIYSHIEDDQVKNALYALGAVSQRAALLDYQSLYNKVAIDKYAFVRNAYLQKRQAEIQRNTELSDPYYEASGSQGVITIGQGNSSPAPDYSDQESGVIVIGGSS
jgi:phospholipid-binding lipoprotein MlaA